VKVLGVRTLTVVLSTSLLASCAIGGSSPVSAEQIREKFVSAGGTCTTPVKSDLSTTSSEARKESSSASYVVLESHSCGEGEGGFDRFETEADALKSSLFLEGIFFGLRKQIGLEDDGNPDAQILVGEWRITVTEADSSRVDSLAAKLNGTVYDFADPRTRSKVLRDITKDDPLVALKEVSKGCLADEALSTDGRSVSFDTEGEDDFDGDLVSSVFCTLRVLGAPDYVFDKIVTTRALDGRTEETWDKFAANWSYHPDSGLRLTVIGESN